MKCSIIITNYNGERYINDCIESLISQSYKNFEIIFYDDCSTDNSVKLIKEYKNIKILINKKKGKHPNFNQINGIKKCFKVSSGEVIFFLDSDDFFKKKKIEKILYNFKDNSNLIFDLPIIFSKKKTKFKKKINLSPFPEMTSTSCLSMRRNVLKDILNKIAKDRYYNTWFDFRSAVYAKYMLKNYKVLNDHLTFYRIRNDSVTNKFSYLGISWWERRLEYHLYLKWFLKKNNIKYKNNFDYIITKILCHLIKLFKY